MTDGGPETAPRGGRRGRAVASRAAGILGLLLAAAGVLLVAVVAGTVVGVVAGSPALGVGVGLFAGFAILMLARGW